MSNEYAVMSELLAETFRMGAEIERLRASNAELVGALTDALMDVESYKYDYPDHHVVESCNHTLLRGYAALKAAS